MLQEFTEISDICAFAALFPVDRKCISFVEFEDKTDQFQSNALLTM